MATKDGWISYSVTSGTGSGNVQVSVLTDNPTPYPRSGILTGQAMSGSRPSDVLIVTQNGREGVLKDSNGLYLKDSNGLYLLAY